MQNICHCLHYFSLSLGSAIKCYNCKDYTGTCSKIRDCYYDDACVSVYERGEGDLTHVHCVFLYTSTNLALYLPLDKNVSLSLCLPSLLGGDTYRQCIKYSECDYNTIAQKLPKLSSFKFSCCATDLCNTGSMSLASHSVMGILLSLALFWWCVL